MDASKLCCRTSWGQSTRPWWQSQIIYLDWSSSLWVQVLHVLGLVEPGTGTAQLLKLPEHLLYMQCLLCLLLRPQQTAVSIRTAQQGRSACGLQLLDGGLDALLEAQKVAQESLTSAGILTGDGSLSPLAVMAAWIP